MSQAQSLLEPAPAAELQGSIALGVVDYLNTVPLIAGLEGVDSLSIRSDFPANQVALLEEDVVDLALCSSIDLVKSRVPLMAVPVGMLGCDGPTMTVRLFSRVPIEEIGLVHCDRESHTSVELLRILLSECHGVEPELVQFDPRAMVGSDVVPPGAEAVLMIGDKVVTTTLPEEMCRWQLDLGEEWHSMTGMPFVFATWLCRVDRSAEELERIRHLARILNRTRLRNAFRMDQIAAVHGPRHGWPVELAGRYLMEYLRFDLDGRALAGLRRFIELAGGSQGCVRLLDGI